MKYRKLKHLFPSRKGSHIFTRYTWPWCSYTFRTHGRKSKELCIKKELDNWQINVKAGKKVKHYEKYAVNSGNAYLNLSIANTQNYAVCV